MIRFKSLLAKYSAQFVGFLLLVMIITVGVINVFVTPELKRTEGKVVVQQVSSIAVEIIEQLRQVEAQSRSITQTVALLDSAAIDPLLPGLIDQYGDPNVFGGGVWPLPDKREPGRDKFSTFYHRDGNNKLVLNTYWNSPESLKYYEQPWHTQGVKSARGTCKWAAAYKDDASAQPRTNCAMPIYKDDALWGVSTIDVTLGFFNRLVAEKEAEIGGMVMIVEGDGKILSNSSRLPGELVLKNVSELAAGSPFVAAIRDLLGKQAGSALADAEFDNGDADYTLFLTPVQGTPWLLAAAIPTATLTQQSGEILSRLGLVQIPLAALFMLLLILSLRMLIRRVDALRANIDALSAGDADLTTRLKVEAADEIGRTSEAFNRFIEKLRGMFLQVREQSDAVDAAASGLQRSARQVEEASGRQSEAVTATAAGVEQVTVSVQHIAETARHFEEVARKTGEATDEGLKLVSDVAGEIARIDESMHSLGQTMDQLGERSRQVETIVAVIKDIADQTNLLALNAAIEAARAGELGRGFAVVADEVRKLAARTTDATGEIATIVNSIRQEIAAAETKVGGTRGQIEQGVALSRRAASAIGTVSEDTRQLVAQVADIADATREQAAASTDIARNVEHISNMAQTNRDTVNEMSGAVRHLGNLSDALRGIIGRFRL